MVEECNEVLIPFGCCVYIHISPDLYIVEFYIFNDVHRGCARRGTHMSRKRYLIAAGRDTLPEEP